MTTETLSPLEEARKKLRERGPVMVNTHEAVEAYEDTGSALEAARNQLKQRKDAEGLSSPEEEEQLSVFERLVGQPFERASERMTDTMSRVAGQGQPSMEQQMNDPEALKQAYQNSTNLGSVLLQTAALPISIAFDSASEAIIMGAEEAFELLPAEGQEWVHENIKALLETKTGQVAMNAYMTGAEAWGEFEETYPNEAANFKSVFDVASVPKFAAPKKVPELIPMKLEKVGLVNSTKPLAGRDKEVFNIAFLDDRKPIPKGQEVTGPKGILGKQEVLATPEQLEVVDLLKQAGVNGNNTLRTNYNLVQDYMANLDKALIAQARKSKATWPEIDTSVRQNMQARFQEMVKGNPSLFATKGNKQKAGQLFQEFIEILDEQGGTAEGLIVARRMFDDRVGRMGIDLSGSKISTNSLSAMAVRNAVNDTIKTLVPDASDAFAKSSKLISPMAQLEMKAAKEAKGAVGRYFNAIGLEGLTGHTGRSILLNSPIVGTLALGVSPVYVLRNAMKRSGPANFRAKLAYVKRDVKAEMVKAIKNAKDPVMKTMLAQNRAAAFAAIDTAAKVLEEEEARREQQK